VENIGALASILGCSVAGLPMKYMGLPLGASYKDVVMWNDMIEQLKRQMVGWKRIYLSKGGHLTLIKSTCLTFQLTFYLYFLF
jgi:hypothetical protein